MTADKSKRNCPRCDERLYYLQPSCPSCESSVRWNIRCVRCGDWLEDGGDACSSCGLEQPGWRAIEHALSTTGETIRVAKDALDRPMKAGYYRHVGSVKGQWADYRRPLKGGGEIHVRSYGDHYEVHLDSVGALDSPGKHAVWYAPRVAADGGIQVIETVTKALSYSNRVVNRVLGKSDNTDSEKH